MKILRPFAGLIVATGLALVSQAQSTLVPAASRDSLRQEIEQIRALPLSELGPKARVFIQSLQPEQIAEIRSLILDAPSSAENDALVGQLLERWARFDGPAALDHARKSTSVWRVSFETHALVGWVRSDPRAAWDRLMIVSNRGADPRYDEGAVLSAIAERDLPLALELFEDLTSDRACLMCNASILTANALHQRQLPIIQHAIAQLSPGPSRDALRDAYWEVLGRRSTESALAEMAGIESSDDQHAARLHVAKGWASRDFAPCLDYVLASYTGELREEILLAIIQVWATGAVPEDVAAVIKKLPSNLSERSLLGLVPILARVDPRAATTWSVSLPVSAVRTKCIGDAIWTWAQIDAEPAHEFFRQEKDTETAGILLWNYLLARVGNNTLRLADFDDLTDRFNLDWRVRLLSEVSLRLANPTINRAGSFDLKAYRAWVEQQKSYNEKQLSEILRPLSGK